MYVCIISVVVALYLWECLLLAFNVISLLSKSLFKWQYFCGQKQTFFLNKSKKEFTQEEINLQK